MGVTIPNNSDRLPGHRAQGHRRVSLYLGYWEFTGLILLLGKPMRLFSVAEVHYSQWLVHFLFEIFCKCTQKYSN